MSVKVVENALETQREYCCPGESGAISRAVHESRLANGWHGCQTCIWNPDASEPADDGLVLTDQGVYGPYLNVLDRSASQLVTAVICDSLVKYLDEKPHLVVGFDQVFGGPDIATGVVRSACRSSCNVHDVGYATFASMEFALRHADAHAAILVHQADRNGTIGIAFFGQAGLPFHLEWNRFGIECRSQIHAASRLTSLKLPANPPPIRHGRDSGNLTTVEIEAAYTTRLLRFWNSQRRLNCEIVARNPLTERYLQTVLSQNGNVLTGAGSMQIEIASDDREFHVIQDGSPLAPERMAEIINSSSGVSQHLTAHLASSGQQLVLIDAANHSSCQHELISDALAVVGVLLTAIDGRDDRN